VNTEHLHGQTDSSSSCRAVAKRICCYFITANVDFLQQTLLDVPVPVVHLAVKIGVVVVAASASASPS
jgi:hypothetical protein